jgi:hypothetical protein
MLGFAGRLLSMSGSQQYFGRTQGESGRSKSLWKGDRTVRGKLCQELGKSILLIIRTCFLLWLRLRILLPIATVHFNH